MNQETLLNTGQISIETRCHVLSQSLLFLQVHWVNIKLESKIESLSASILFATKMKGKFILCFFQIYKNDKLT